MWPKLLAEAFIAFLGDIVHSLPFPPSALVLAFPCTQSRPLKPLPPPNTHTCTHAHLQKHVLAQWPAVGLCQVALALQRHGVHAWVRVSWVRPSQTPAPAIDRPAFTSNPFIAYFSVRVCMSKGNCICCVRAALKP